MPAVIKESLVSDVIYHPDDLLATYLYAIGHIPRLTPDEEKALARRKAKDTNARNQFIAANLRLVVAYAKKFVGRHEFADMIQDGNLGLVYAANTFDSRRGTRFSTHAHWPILGEIMGGISDNRTILLPRGMVDEILRQAKSGTLNNPDQKSRKLKRYDTPPLSLDHDSQENGRGIKLESIADPQLSPDRIIDEKSLLKNLYELIDMLSPRQATLLKLKYGLAGKESHTFADIANVMGIPIHTARVEVHNAVNNLRVLIIDNKFDDLRSLLK